MFIVGTGLKTYDNDPPRNTVLKHVVVGANVGKLSLHIVRARLSCGVCAIGPRLTHEAATPVHVTGHVVIQFSESLQSPRRIAAKSRHVRTLTLQAVRVRWKCRCHSSSSHHGPTIDRFGCGEIQQSPGIQPDILDEHGSSCYGGTPRLKRRGIMVWRMARARVTSDKRATGGRGLASA